MPEPSTIHGRRQIGTAATRRGGDPSYVEDQARRASSSQDGAGSTPHTRSIRLRLVNAPASVVGPVTHTGTPAARRPSTSDSRFSSALARTRSGSSARTLSRSGYFEPPTRVTSSPAGWMQ